MKVKSDHGSEFSNLSNWKEEALILFFRLLLSNCLNWKMHCDVNNLLVTRVSGKAKSALSRS